MLGDDVVRLSALGQIVRGRWRLLAVCAAAGALLGIGASLVFSPGYESVSRVLLQGPRDEEELQTEAQVAMSSVVLDRTATALGGDLTGAGLRGSVSVEVLDGHVIELRGSAASPERARQLTEQMTREYLTFSTQLVSGASAASAEVLQERRDTLQQRVTETNRRLAELQGSSAASAPSSAEGLELTRLRTTLDDAARELDRLEGRGQEAEAEAAFSRASILVMEPATRPSSRAEPTMVQFIVSGALLCFLLGVFAHLVAARADRRLRNSEQIAAALGAPVLGSVDVPDAAGRTSALDGATASLRWRAGLRRLMHADQPWDASRLPICRSDLDRDVRYRRVLARLRGTPGRILARLRGTPDAVLRLLVLVADDDATAHRAVARLAVAAGIDCGPASVVTDLAGFSRLVQVAGGGRPATSTGRLTVRSGPEPVPGTHRTVLHVVEVSAARPTVPDCGRVSGALLVLTAGTRTSWELIDIAEACADAGYQVLGAFVTHRIRPLEDQPIEPTQGDSSTVVPLSGKKMAGSA